ncbi:hypothetical protein ES705_37955 [subsurface metagenome]
MRTLTQKRVKKILKEFKKGIENTLRDKFVELVLFGSYARGDYEFGSDIDVLLLVREKLTSEEEKKILELSSAISLEYDMVITCFDYPYDAFQSWETPFLMNVRREGVII